MHTSNRDIYGIYAAATTRAEVNRATECTSEKNSYAAHRRGTFPLHGDASCAGNANPTKQWKGQHLEPTQKIARHCHNEHQRCAEEKYRKCEQLHTVLQKDVGRCEEL